MKTTMKILMFLCFVFLLAGCGDKPTAVAEKFITTLVHGEFEEAKKYSTKETGQLIDLWSEMAKNTGDKKHLKDFKFVPVREEIDGDHATVYFRDGTNEKEESIALVKEDGKWKADIPKQ